jgi:hypothetical protein
MTEQHNSAKGRRGCRQTDIPMVDLLHNFPCTAQTRTMKELKRGLIENLVSIIVSNMQHNLISHNPLLYNHHSVDDNPPEKISKGIHAADTLRPAERSDAMLCCNDSDLRCTGHCAAMVIKAKSLLISLLDSGLAWTQLQLRRDP